MTLYTIDTPSRIMLDNVPELVDPNLVLQAVRRDKKKFNALRIKCSEARINIINMSES